MNRKDICAFLIGCEAEELMAYTDYAETGCVVLGPDGRKYRFDVDQLEKAEARRSEALTPKPKPKLKPEPATKKSTRPKFKPKTGAKL